LYSGTAFKERHFHPEQAVLFIRGVCHVLSPVCQRVAKEFAAMLYVPEVILSRVAPGAHPGDEKHPGGSARFCRSTAGGELLTTVAVDFLRG
jgi:hypothetical protein